MSFFFYFSGLDFGDCHRSLFAHDESVSQVLFQKETHYVFSAGKDGEIKQWDADKVWISIEQFYFLFKETCPHFSFVENPFLL